MQQPLDKSFLISPKVAELARQQKTSNETVVKDHVLRQEATRLAFLKMEMGEADIYNPVFMRRRYNTLEQHVLRKTARSISKTSKDEIDEDIAAVEAVREIDEAAARFNQKNPLELEKEKLLALRASIKDEDSPNEILRKVLRSYSDYALADMALDFLLDTTKGKLRENVEIAKKIFYQNFEHEIAAYKNTLMLSQVFSKEGLAGPSSLRELYRDISGNPQDPYVLFDKLSQNFTYDHLRKVVRYLLHSLGADLTSKGPSIERGELYKLFGEVRTLQAILGIYLFFRSRMKLLRSLFSKNELTLPATLNFETISKAFVELLKEKFISLERLKLQSKSLDLDEILEQIFIYTQMRDGIRNVSPRLYKTEKQKQELLRTIIEYLEDLDDQLEEEEEDKEKKKKKEEKDA